MKEKSVKVPVINDRIIIFIYEEIEQFNKRFKNLYFDVNIEYFQAGCFEIDKGVVLAFHNNGKLTNGIIAHESKHAVNLMFKNIHYKLDLENDEMECYYLGWVVDEVYKILDLK